MCEITCEQSVSEVCETESIDIPNWIELDRIEDGTDIESIQYGGCASGAYMPAVNYHDANKTMAEHGDDVLDYINDQLGEMPKPDDTESWTGMACFYLSCAVELWVNQFEVTDSNLV